MPYISAAALAQPCTVPLLGKRRCKAAGYSPKPSTQSVTSTVGVLAEKRSPSTHSPVPAKPANSSPEPPIPEEADVQKGTTVLPEKSLPSANVLTGQAASSTTSEHKRVGRAAQTPLCRGRTFTAATRWAYPSNSTSS